MSFCNKCHAPLDLDACFCNHCGSPVISAAGANAVLPQAAPPKDAQWAAITALVCGICSIVFFCIPFVPGVLGIIFGIIGLKSTQKTMAIFGIVLGSVGVAMSILGLLWYLFVVIIASQIEPYSYEEYEHLAVVLRLLTV